MLHIVLYTLTGNMNLYWVFGIGTYFVEVYYDKSILNVKYVERENIIAFLEEKPVYQFLGN